MSEVVFANEKLISTKRASELSGYSQDYLGQLCRSGGLDCKMISDQWFIDPISLKKYVPDINLDTLVHTHEHEHKTDDENTKEGHKHTKAEKRAYSVKVADVRSGAFKYDGDDFIPTQKAAEISGYTQDYIGQLARSGEIQARKVGRRWYIARKALEEHRATKDAMLQAVQSDSSGVVKINKHTDTDTGTKVPINTEFDIKYFSDTGTPLIPQGTIHHTYQSDDSPLITKAHETEIEETKVGRFGAINTHLGYTREEKISTKSAPLITPEPSKDVHKVEKVTIEHNIVSTNASTSSKILLYSLIVTFILSSTLFILIYLGVVQKSVLEPLRPIYNAVKSLEYRYGTYAPGKTIEYSN